MEKGIRSQFESNKSRPTCEAKFQTQVQGEGGSQSWVQGGGGSQTQVQGGGGSQTQGPRGRRGRHELNCFAFLTTL